MAIDESLNVDASTPRTGIGYPVGLSARCPSLFLIGEDGHRLILVCAKETSL